MKHQFEYKLSSSVSVSVGKEEKTSSDVIVKAPRNSDSRWQLEFEHYVHKAAMGINKMFNPDDSGKEVQEETDDPAKPWAMIMITCSSPEDFRCMVNLLKELLCSGNTKDPQATIGGTKFTKPIFDELSANDIKALVGRYAYHFLSKDLR